MPSTWTRELIMGKNYPQKIEFRGRDILIHKPNLDECRGRGPGDRTNINSQKKLFLIDSIHFHFKNNGQVDFEHIVIFFLIYLHLHSLLSVTYLWNLTKHVRFLWITAVSHYVYVLFTYNFIIYPKHKVFMACTVHVLFLVSGFCIDNNAVM